MDFWWTRARCKCDGRVAAVRVWGEMRRFGSRVCIQVDDRAAADSDAAWDHAAAQANA